MSARPSAGDSKLQCLVRVMLTAFLYPKRVTFPSNMGVSTLPVSQVAQW